MESPVSTQITPIVGVGNGNTQTPSNSQSEQLTNTFDCDYPQCVGRTATHICQKCTLTNRYCEEHTTRHDMRLAAKGHKCVPLESVVFCPTDTREVADDWCVDCKMAVCCQCQWLEQHTNHKIISVDQLKRQLSEANTEDVDSRIQRIDRLINQRQNTDAELKQTTEKILNSVEAFTEHIKSQQQKLQEHLQADIHKMENMRNILAAEKDSMRRSQGLLQGTNADVFKAAQHMLSDMRPTAVPNLSDAEMFMSIPPEWTRLANSGIMKCFVPHYTTTPLGNPLPGSSSMVRASHTTHASSAGAPTTTTNTTTTTTPTKRKRKRPPKHRDDSQPSDFELM